MHARNVWMSFAVLCFCRPAVAQQPFTKFDRGQAQMKVFAVVYSHYIDLVKTQGIAGLKTLATTDFKLKWDSEIRTGAAAFSELKKYVVTPPESGPRDAFSVKLRRLTIIGNRAIVQTEETGAFHFRENYDSRITASWIWKQTWRKTPQGWRLAVWEMGTEKLPGPDPAITYTLSWKPKEPNALSVPPVASDHK